MKKITILFLTLICFFITDINAQVLGYTFSKSNGTYTPITGGTVLGNASSDDERFIDTSSPLGVTSPLTGVGIDIGFNFVYNGFTYDKFAINNNGWISLGTSTQTPSVNINSSSSYTALSTTTTTVTNDLVARIAAFARDLQGQTGSELRFETIGTAPNRTLVVQWTNYRRYLSTGATGNNINFQIRLNETTNVVDIVYGTVTTDISTTCQVGLRANPNTPSTNYNSRTTTTDWAASTASTAVSNTMTVSATIFPASGLTYSWAPPSCLAPTGLVAANITATTADISWVAPSPAPSSGYQYVVSTTNTAPTGAGTAITGTSVSLTGLTPATNYYVFVRSNCGGSFSAWNGTATFLTLCVPVTSLPWTENFDTLTALGTTSYPPCWTKENGDWSTTNATTYNTARSGANYLRDAYTATNEYVWTPGFQLTAGTSYDFSTFVQGDNGSTWFVDMFYNTSANSTGATQLGTAYNPAGSDGTYSPQSYVEMRRTFVPSTTGVYFFAIRVNEASGNPWYVAFDDFKLELTPSCSAPNPSASSITSNSATISWAAVTGSVNYEYVLDNVAANPSGAGTSTTATTYNATGLTQNTVYYFHVRNNCGAGSFSVWSTVSFTTLPTPPVNDNCTAPIALTVGGVYTDNDIDTTNLGGTLSAESPNPTCGTTGFTTSGKDIWFSVVVPASGSLTIETNVDSVGGAGLLLDPVTAVYSGTCASLTQVGCDDSSGNTTTPTGADYSKLALTGLTAGDTLLVRAYGWSGSQGTFSISAYDASLATTSFDLAGFKALPNPVKDVFKVSYVKEISSITVHNLLGQEIINKKVNGFNSDVDMSNLASGTYLVKVTSEGLTNTIKVIKE